MWAWRQSWSDQSIHDPCLFLRSYKGTPKSKRRDFSNSIKNGCLWLKIIFPVEMCECVLKWNTKCWRYSQRLLSSETRRPAQAFMVFMWIHPGMSIIHYVNFTQTAEERQAHCPNCPRTPLTRTVHPHTHTQCPEAILSDAGCLSEADGWVPSSPDASQSSLGEA